VDPFYQMHGEMGFAGDPMGFGADPYGIDPYGADPYGVDPYGTDPFGGRRHRGHPAQHAQAAAPQMSPQQKQALWQAHQRKIYSHRRRMMLDPNMGSEIKIERYTFSLFNNNPIAFTLGTGGYEVNFSGQPDVTIRPERVLMNAPSPGFVTIQEIKVANVSATVGGQSDAFEYSPLAVGSALSIPTIQPQNRATVLGLYSGMVPAGFVPGATYPFTVTFQGTATMTPEY
jgi:hypothetical protein